MAAALLWEPCLDGWRAAGGFFWVCSSPSLQGESSRAPSASCPGLCPPPRRRKRWGTPRVKDQVLTQGLLSHFAHRMDNFLGKYPSFGAEGGYCLQAWWWQGLEGVGMAQCGFNQSWELLWHFWHWCGRCCLSQCWWQHLELVLTALQKPQPCS